MAVHGTKRKERSGGSITRRELLAAAGVGAVGMTFLGQLAQALGQTAATLPATAPARPPNIIVILADDVGIADLSCTGGKYPTPNIDALAKGGLRFEYCYASPLCGPSRAQMLTGRYPFRTGMTGNGTGAVLKPANEIMIPTVLKKAGYVTAQVGKWGQLPLGPRAWGFEEFMHFQGNGVYWNNRDKPYKIFENGKEKDLPDGKYMPDLMHEWLVDFINRRKDKPFYVHYAMSHVHCDMVTQDLLPTPDTPESEKKQKHPNYYADNLAYMDKLVGKLVAELDRLKLRENTIIMFTGDNGTSGGEQPITVHGKKIFGWKNHLDEGGCRVPLIVNCPGTVPAGKVLEDMTDFSDFFPTILDLGGAKAPQGVKIDGESFAPQVRGQAGQPRSWVYAGLRKEGFVRDARYKLTHDGKLFDMKDAPFNEIPVAADTTEAGALASRKRLQPILDEFDKQAATSPAASQPTSTHATPKRGGEEN